MVSAAVVPVGMGFFYPSGLNDSFMNEGCIPTEGAMGALCQRARVLIYYT